MNTNINDPTAVKALLDRLKASQAWQDTLSSSHLPHGEESSAKNVVQGESSASPSVASLLSQLRTSAPPSIPIDKLSVPTTRITPNEASRDVPRPSQEPPPQHWTPRPVAATPSQDLRSLSFQQALPHLTQLASEPKFLDAVSRLRQEQNDLEKQLWEEREAIHKKHEEKAKVARTKATLIGAGLSKHEADMMNDAYHRDLRKFDSQRVLLAWDALIQKQQAALETLGVPTLFATTSQADCQKQRRIVQVLEGL